MDYLVAAAARRDAFGGGLARMELLDWCRRELLPHARAEEAALYPAARETTQGRLLVEALLGEHAVIGRLVDGLAAAVDVVHAAATAASLSAIFGSHADKENDLVLPLLAGSPGVSVAGLLAGMHTVLGEPEAPATPADPAEGRAGGCAGHACACDEEEPAGDPELDVREIPHAIRHATVFGALEATPMGAGLLLVAPHDPLPLLDQVNQRWPSAFSVDYRERGPQAWRLRLVRTG